MKLNRHPNISTRSRARGITLVEILVVVAVLLILASFAVPSMSNATVKAELTATVENVEYSIQAARNIARMNETPITVQFDQAGAGTQTISFRAKGSANTPGIQDYLLPEGIQLVSGQGGFEFDSRGLVEIPGTIILVAKADESITSTIEVK